MAPPKTIPCLRCEKPIRRAARMTSYCSECVRIAKNCSECSKPIAAFNRLGVCIPCQKKMRKKEPSEMGGFDWWEDR